VASVSPWYQALEKKLDEGIKKQKVHFAKEERKGSVKGQGGKVDVKDFEQRARLQQNLYDKCRGCCLYFRKLADRAYAAAQVVMDAEHAGDGASAGDGRRR